MVHETRESILSRLVYGGILPCHAFISFSTLESREFHPVRNRCNGDSFSRDLPLSVRYARILYFLLFLSILFHYAK